MIEKQIKIDRIEIVGDFRCIQARLRVDIVEDGEVIGRLPFVRLPAKSPEDDIDDYPDITVGKEKIKLPAAINAEIKSISEKVWTQELKAEFATLKQLQQAKNNDIIKQEVEDE